MVGTMETPSELIVLMLQCLREWQMQSKIYALVKQIIAHYYDFHGYYLLLDNFILFSPPSGPEYASASICDYPTNETDASQFHPVICTDNNTSNDYTPFVHSHTVQPTHPGLVSGGVNSSQYTGPITLPVSAATIRPATRHSTTPNASHRPQPAGLFFVQPPPAFNAGAAAGQRSTDTTGFGPILPHNYNIYPHGTLKPLPPHLQHPAHLNQVY